MSNIAEQLRPEIESHIINYLKSKKLIDMLHRNNQIQLNVEGNPSDAGYHLDYGSFQIESGYGHSAEKGIHKVTTVFWEMPNRIMKNNRPGPHHPGSKITGIVTEMVFRVEFDENTGNPKIIDLTKLESSPPRVR